ncbi:MAG: hypothetical protein K2K08_03940 [Paramuribaculum sp.]|nr:hypothetical protein [Paramuribaculum sp.]
MSKFLRLIVTLAIAAAVTACNENGSDEPTIDPVESTIGAIIVNQGSYYANISGSLTYLDFATNSANQTAFEAANAGGILGDTPQSALVYGSKLYIAVYESNLIRVLDARNFKLIKDIRPDASTGTQPRFFATDKNKVYVTMFDGYVARIDTASLAIDASVKVGPNPDGITVCGDFVYAGNSDGMNYELGFANGYTVSKIAISSFTEVEKINVGMNPGAMATVGSSVFVVVRGDYGTTTPSLLKRIKSDGSVENIAPATYISPAASSIVYVNAPWGEPVTTVYAYSPTTGKTNSITIDPIAFPAAIAIDPYTGLLIITGYNLKNGSPDYMGGGFANLYDANGLLIKSYPTGLNPCAITFNTLL